MKRQQKRNGKIKAMTGCLINPFIVLIGCLNFQLFSPGSLSRFYNCDLENADEVICFVRELKTSLLDNDHGADSLEANEKSALSEVCMTYIKITLLSFF